MNVIDISRELFQSSVYPGDPKPGKIPFLSIEKGDICNLTILSMGSHTGTHLDAPSHFYKNGKSMEKLDLVKCVGECKVVCLTGKITNEVMTKALQDGTKRLLIKGNVEFTLEAAQVCSKMQTFLIGVESQTVGIEGTQVPIHRELLGNEIVILEGLVLDHVMEGQYILAAQPLKMEGLDGSPVRAVLMEIEKN